MRSAAIRFAAWLRYFYLFPVRVPVYLSPRELLTTIDGESAVATFFAPWEPNVEPYIRVATGDYPILLAESGRDNALADILCSLAHEIIHYRQWIFTGETHEAGVSSKASRIIDAYARYIAHP